MNTINFFNSKKKFPISTQSIDFLQTMVKTVFQLARIGGSDNYILTGCENTNGNTWLSGYVVINGELLPFMGGTGTGASSVRIKETKTDVVAGYDTYSEAYTTRVVEFGSNVGGANTFVWNTFTRLKSNAEIVRDFATKAELDAVRLLVMPRGAIMEYDIKNNPLPLPTGWVFAGGGTQEGYGNLPDKRGRVSIGYDPNSNNLPVNVVDGKEENYGNVGNTGGKPAVTLTSGQSGSPEINVSIDIKAGDEGTNNSVPDDFALKYLANPYGKVTVTKSIEATNAAQSHENRMPYVVSYYIVKIV
jgi:microcystin-dependent protein